ncbi:MAG: ABC transporter permease [Lachnospiraceae bacterium]|nr:ABC transporter permease [Lachnospiraceae bacterium]
MVAKRFFRNKLAIVGLVIIACMFIFSFIGGMLIPYSQSQVFYTTTEMRKDYAGATEIDQFQFQLGEGASLPKDIYSKMILADMQGDSVIETKDGTILGAEKVGDKMYILYSLTETKGGADVLKAYKALEKGESTIEAGGKIYFFAGKDDAPIPTFYEGEKIATASQMSFTAYAADMTMSLDFCEMALRALGSNMTGFEADGVTYSMEVEEGSALVTAAGEEYCFISNMNFNAIGSDVYLTPDYKLTALEAIENGDASFVYADAEGNEVEYEIENKNGQYTIKRFEETKVIATYEAPSKEHIFGTDANGMDLLARLMYGGRISLSIGFVVVFIEVFIGMIMGGIAGYFGKWVDNLIMRIVDVIYCIPSIPLYMILGSIMDYYKASSTVRIYVLCIVMGALGWAGIARIVRGQILSLREQEFMVAAEATGISTYRRIFKHLIPNVVPQLIVFASMGLGEVILAEATLSFLGLGIKYPAASWGSIINAVNDSFVMTNYLFVWIPAGLFILLTVLAFNFIGDGLRDAFDPKMKR